jgi:hypothetical protein
MDNSLPSPIFLKVCIKCRTYHAANFIIEGLTIARDVKNEVIIVLTSRFD